MTSKNHKPAKISKARIYSTICFLLIVAALALAYFLISKKADEPSAPVVAASGDLVLHMVDVGQGDALILTFPDGKNMLVDCGPDNGKDTAKDSNLTDTIDSLGITKFDYFLATHQDEDHIGYAETIFANYDVDFVFRPHVKSGYSLASSLPEGVNDGSGKLCTTLAYYNFLKYMVDEESEWEFFNKNSDFTVTYSFDDGTKVDCVFDFLTPTAEVPNISYSDANDYSPIIIVTFGGRKIMLTGDAESAAEAELINYYAYNLADFDIDVLKVGHHGSSTSTDEEFFNIVKPEYALISCGTGNSYQHPHAETMQLMRENGVVVYRTDLNGNITMTINRSGNISFSTDKSSTIEESYSSPQAA